MIDHIVTKEIAEQIANFNYDFITFIIQNKDTFKAKNWIKPYKPIIEFFETYSEKELREICKSSVCFFQPKEETIALIKKGGEDRYIPNAFMKSVVYFTNNYINILNNAIISTKGLSAVAQQSIGIIPARNQEQILQVFKTIYGSISSIMDTNIPLLLGCHEIEFEPRFNINILKKSNNIYIKNDIFMSTLKGK